MILNFSGVRIHPILFKSLEMGAYCTVVLQLIIFGMYLYGMKLGELNTKLLINVYFKICHYAHHYGLATLFYPSTRAICCLCTFFRTHRSFGCHQCQYCCFVRASPVILLKRFYLPLWFLSHFTIDELYFELFWYCSSGIMLIEHA